MLIYFLNFVWMLTSVFLMLVILIQRGRGGGLAGAFGAVGGSSAFGTRAGDTMTKVTVGVFLFWLLQAGILVKLMSTSNVQKEVEKLGGAVENKKSDDDGLGGAPLLPPAGKSDAAPDSKTDAKTESKPESKPETKTEPKKDAPASKPILPPTAAAPTKTDAPPAKKPAEVPKAAKPDAAAPAKDGKKN